MLRARMTHLLQIRAVQDEDENNAIYSFFQIEPVTDRLTYLTLQLFASVIKEPCFDTLRTKQGLGYIVFCGVGLMRGVAGLYVIAQGAAMDASRIDDAAHTFVQDFEHTLAAMSESYIATYREALQDKLEQAPLTLGEAAMDAWGQVQSGQYRFDHVTRDVTTLNTITRDSLLDFYRARIAASGYNFRKLTVEVFGKGEEIRMPEHATPNNTVLLSEDFNGGIPAWQAAQQAFPPVWDSGIQGDSARRFSRSSSVVAEAVAKLGAGGRLRKGQEGNWPGPRAPKPRIVR
jgi:secreted Zn-dependent insulinase-like peptidase